MRSRDLRWLIANEAREMLASRAYWLLLLATGLLVGHAFLTAVDTYAEMSASGRGPAALAEGLSPLDGVAVPTFGVLSLAATLLLPFVAIRAIGHDRRTGAWQLMVQGPFSVRTLLSAKLLIVLIAWGFASIPAYLALLLWTGAGNHLGLAETCAVIAGHALFAWLTVGVAASATAITESEASAAVVALGFTIGTWALEFVGAVRGGWIARVAEFTPTSALRSFEEGLIRADTVTVMLVIGLLGLGLAAAWLRPGVSAARRWRRAAAVIGVGGVAAGIGSRLESSWDLSENRRNSFPALDEIALRQIHLPLRVEVHLAPEDPRRTDLKRELIDKLERVLPGLRVTYVSRTRTGLFEQTDPEYGQSWYQIGTQRVATRSTTASIVLPVLYDLAHITPPPSSISDYPGYPLVARPRGTELLFFVCWPLLIVAAFVAWRTFGRRALRQLTSPGVV